MAVPTIDSSQGILGYRAFESFSFLAGGVGSPEILYWQATSLPVGLAIDAPAEKPLTTPFGVAATDVVSCAGHGFANGDKVYFQTLTGGTGLAVQTVYYVRDKTTDSLKLAATLTGAAIDFSTDITAGQLRKCGTSLISGSVGAEGQYVIGLIAVNATGPSAIAYFTLGIEAGDGSGAVAGSSDTGIDVSIDVATREVTVGAGGMPMLKEDDTAIFNIRWKRGGVALDPNPTDINIAFKEKEDEPVLFSAGGVVTTAWAKSGTGAAAFCQVPVTPTGDLLAAALADNDNKPDGAQFEALCEIEWKQTIAPIGGVTQLVASTKTFKIILARDLVV